MILSILVTTYNRAKYLDELLKVLEHEVQGLDNILEYEIIVADNASTDRTAEVVTEAAGRGLKFRYIQRPINLRFPGNLRESVKEACGRFIWPLCDDDLVEPGTIRKIADCLLAEAGPVLYLLNRNIYNINMDRLLKRNALSRETRSTLKGAELISLFGADLLTASCVIIRRDYAMIGIHRPDYDGLYCETLVLACEALYHGEGVVLGDIFVKYREGNTGSWNVWWPVISLYNMPFVIDGSRIGCSSPDLVKQYVKNRGGGVAEGLCRLRSSKKTELLSNVDLKKMRLYYSELSHFPVIFSLAFDLPKWVSSGYVYSILFYRFVMKFGCIGIRDPMLFLGVATRKFKEFHNKQIAL
jgi:glycosyltransferase involved in cell wall biosynthesis